MEVRQERTAGDTNIRIAEMNSGLCIIFFSKKNTKGFSSGRHSSCRAMGDVSLFAPFDLPLLEQLASHLTYTQLARLLSTGDKLFCYKFAQSITAFHGFIHCSKTERQSLFPSRFFNRLSKLRRLALSSKDDDFCADESPAGLLMPFLPPTLVELSLSEMAIHINSTTPLENLALPNLTCLKLQYVTLFVANERASFADIVLRTATCLCEVWMSECPVNVTLLPLTVQEAGLSIRYLEDVLPPNLTKLTIEHERPPHNISLQPLPSSVTDVVLENPKAILFKLLPDSITSLTIYLRGTLKQKTIAALTRFTKLQTLLVENHTVKAFDVDLSVLPQSLTRVSSSFSVYHNQWRHLSRNLRFEPSLWEYDEHQEFAAKMGPALPGVDWNRFAPKITSNVWAEYGTFVPQHLVRICLTDFVPPELSSLHSLVHVTLHYHSKQLPSGGWPVVLLNLPGSVERLDVTLHELIYSLPWFLPETKKRLHRLATLNVFSNTMFVEMYVLNWFAHLPETLRNLHLRLSCKSPPPPHFKLPPLAELTPVPLRRLDITLEGIILVTSSQPSVPPTLESCSIYTSGIDWTPVGSPVQLPHGMTRSAVRPTGFPVLYYDKFAPVVAAPPPTKTEPLGLE